MANWLKLGMVQTIEALFRKGWSRRRIAREVGILRETVGKCIRELTQGPAKPEVERAALQPLAADRFPARSTGCRPRSSSAETGPSCTST